MCQNVVWFGERTGLPSYLHAFLAPKSPEVSSKEAPPDLPVEAVPNIQVAGSQLCPSLHRGDTPGRYAHFRATSFCRLKIIYFLISMTRYGNKCAEYSCTKVGNVQFDYCLPYM